MTIVANNPGFVFDMETNSVTSEFITGNTVTYPDTKDIFFGTRSDAEAAGLNFTDFDNNLNT